MERPIKIFGTIVAISCGGIILVVFFTPNTEFAFTLERYQTLFGSVFAAVAAAFTAWAIYRSATEPFRLKQNQIEYDRLKARNRANLIVITAIHGLHMQIIAQRSTAENLLDEPLKPFDVPTILKDFEFVQNLDHELVRLINKTLIKVRAVAISSATPSKWDETQQGHFRAECDDAIESIKSIYEYLSPGVVSDVYGEKSTEGSA